MARIELYEQPIDYNGRITEIADWGAVLEAYSKIKQAIYPKKVLFILDDIHQCEYTSMHASLQDELYFDDEEYSEDIDFESSEQVIGLNNLLESLKFKHYMDVLLKENKHQNSSAIKEKTNFYSGEDFRVITYINESPLKVLNNVGGSNLKEIAVVASEFVTTDPLKIVMQLNGYFTCDFSPFENYFVIEQMSKLGFEFMGIGATLLGFIKKDGFLVKHINQILLFLSEVYPLDETMKEQFRYFLENHNYLILPYCESPAEYLYFYE